MDRIVRHNNEYDAGPSQPNEYSHSSQSTTASSQQQKPQSIQQQQQQQQQQQKKKTLQAKDEL